MNSSSETIIRNGGQQANHSGNALEVFVENALKSHGYTEFINHKDQVFAMRNTIGGKQYSKQPYCGQSIYDTKRNCDFLIMNLEKFPEGLIVECKWQQSSGSVDEKYPFTVHNIMKIGVPTVILIDGGGYKKQALTWLKEQAGKERALVGVYTMSEFQAVVNKGFLG
jgi:hypothetical protein